MATVSSGRVFVLLGLFGPCVISLNNVNLTTLVTVAARVDEDSGVGWFRTVRRGSGDSGRLNTFQSPVVPISRGRSVGSNWEACVTREETLHRLPPHTVRVVKDLVGSLPTTSMSPSSSEGLRKPGPETGLITE